MKIYGWDEQSEVSWGITCREVDDDLIEFVDPSGEVSFTWGGGDGVWYTTFAKAKSEALEIWRHKRDMARLALKQLRSIKKSDLETLNERK